MNATIIPKRLALLATIMLLSLGIFAEGNPLPTTLEEVGQLLSQHPCTRGSFVQEKLLPTIKRPLTSSGTFLITADRGIIWQTEKPYPSIMVVGGSHVSQGTSPDTITRMDTSSNRLFMEFSQAISAAFSGDVKRIQDSFHVNFSHGDSQWTLLLEPREKTVAQLVKSIQLQGDQLLKMVTMTEQTGSTIAYIFSHHSFSQEPTEYENQLLDK